MTFFFLRLKKFQNTAFFSFEKLGGQIVVDYALKIFNAKLFRIRFEYLRDEFWLRIDKDLFADDGPERLDLAIVESHFDLFSFVSVQCDLSAYKLSFFLKLRNCWRYFHDIDSKPLDFGVNLILFDVVVYLH